jgi:NAD+ synthase (glutamine-hydrolysing)
MQINLHQTHHEIADFEALFKTISTIYLTKQPGLHLFPELFLAGYPLLDLVLKKTFIDDYQHFLEDLENWSKSLPKPDKPTVYLIGGLKYEFDTIGLPDEIENVIYQLVPSQGLKVLYTKQILPNYDIYEEKKYFTTKRETVVLNFDDKNIALTICEDMWFSHLHDHDPIEDLKEKIDSENIKLDLVVNLSASPFHLGKFDSRVNRALAISQYLKAPFIYVNRVGAEDEILFDGQSFIVDGNTVIKQAALFKSESLSFECPLYQSPDPINKRAFVYQSSSWSTIYQTRLSTDTLTLSKFSDEDCFEVLEALKLGIVDYCHKNNIKKFSIALSGGMDSSLVLTILKLIKEQHPIEIEAIFMPGLFSSSLSFDLSYDLCRNLGIKLTSMPIKFIHSTIKTLYKDNFSRDLAGLADENIQSRLRGALIYLRSNDMGSVVLNTSNKSEIAVGYSTIYGDSVGALSVLGDLYKSEVFELALYINRTYGQLIPPDVISRPPSAELRENQEDAQSLPPYDRLDPILEALLSGRFGVNDLIKRGHQKNEVLKVYHLLMNSEYKRRQFCPIIKVKPKSFGFGYRVPISKKSL